MKRILLLLVICIMLTGCKTETSTHEDDKNETPTHEDDKNETPTHEDDKIGSISNPYSGDKTVELDITCENPNMKEQSKIELKLKSLVFEDHMDDYFVSCFVTLVDHKSDLPINLDDYISIIYYDDNNQVVGDGEYFFHYSETADRVGLVFNEVISEGWLDHNISHDELKNISLSKVAIQYYQSGQKEKIFFSLEPTNGSAEKPINVDEVDESGFYHTISRDEEQIDSTISNIQYSDEDGFSIQMDFKYCSYFDYTINNTNYSKKLDITDYYTLSFFDEQGLIGKSSYDFQIEQETSRLVKVGDTVTVNAYIPTEDLDNRTPSKVALNFYSYGKERTLYLNLD